MIKGFKKYTKSFEVTKQAAKEKMGKSDTTAETDDVKEIKERLRAIKWNLKQISSSGKQYCDAIGVNGTRGAEFAEALRSFGGDESPINGTPLADSLSRVGSQLKDCEGALVACGLHTSTNVVSPVQQFYDLEVKKVIDIKRRQEVSRLKYDSALTSFKDSEKKLGTAKPAVAEEMKAAQSTYEDLTRDLKAAFEAMVSSMEREMGQYLRELISQRISFHQQQAQLLDRLSQDLGFGSTMQTVVAATEAMTVCGPAGTAPPKFATRVLPAAPQPLMA
eukprot:TRINITY_DN289_c0_g1_i2.p1 TRINITY_DN289_c0_g1~~TRINITY_DN289_c0_g1_i2.p1  ORF type:complete len:277 (-),score=99.67 TRINITY_DN289_c0_g1_i2:526-1356(-)